MCCTFEQYDPPSEEILSLSLSLNMILRRSIDLRFFYDLSLSLKSQMMMMNQCMYDVQYEETVL